MSTSATNDLLPRRIWQRCLELAAGGEISELQTWGGAFRIVGWWVVMIVVFAVAPIWTLFRLSVQRGGWRFLIALTFICLLVTAAVIGIMLLLFALSHSGIR